jgi:hypothetical protein
MIKLGYLVLNKHFAPELLFEIPEDDDRFCWFSWKDEKTWLYNKPSICHLSFEIGDDVYDTSCPILGIYDLNNPEHLQDLVNRSWNQQMVQEDLHLYP